jgi:hypothetical protein
MSSTIILGRWAPAVAALGLTGALLTACGAQGAGPGETGRPPSGDQPGRDVGPYVAHPELAQRLARELSTSHRARRTVARPGSRDHQPPRSEVRDSPCFMNPDHWDHYLEDGFPVCVTIR